MAKRPSTTRAKDPSAVTAAATTAAPKPKRARRAAPAAETAAEHTPVGPTKAEPTMDDIRQRAYERYQARGGNHGSHFDDWLEAEKELRTKK